MQVNMHAPCKQFGEQITICHQLSNTRQCLLVVINLNTTQLQCFFLYLFMNLFIFFSRMRTTSTQQWASGAMDNASDYGSEDSRFDSWLARIMPLLKCHWPFQHPRSLSSLPDPTPQIYKTHDFLFLQSGKQAAATSARLARFLRLPLWNFRCTSSWHQLWRPVTNNFELLWHCLLSFHVSRTLIQSFITRRQGHRPQLYATHLRFFLHLRDMPLDLLHYGTLYS